MSYTELESGYRDAKNEKPDFFVGPDVRFLSIYLPTDLSAIFRPNIDF